MAPISLKDTKITALTENLVSQLTKFKKSSRNFTLSSQYVLSNFRYHKFLDVNSQQVSRLIEGVCQKFKVHSQFEKAEAFKDLCDEFLNAPISQSAQSDVKTDEHYSLISLLLLLSNSPTQNDYQPRQEPSELTDEDTFDWKAYLLGDAEEEVLGIPHSGPLFDWSDDEILESDASPAPEDSGVMDSSSSEDQRLILYDTGNPSVSTLTEKGRLWLSEHVVNQYWEEYPLSSTNMNSSSKFGQCTIADTWETFQQSQNPFHQSTAKKVLTETQIIRETIWMLSGIGNSFIYKYNHNRIQVNSSIQVSHLTLNSLQSLLKKFATVGEQSHELQEFKASILEDVNHASQPSITMQAFANSLATYFKEYKSFLSDIEKGIIKKEATVTLLGLHDKLNTKIKEISVLHSVYLEGVLTYMNKPLPQRVTHLLDAFYHNIRISDAIGSPARWKVSILLRVFLDTVRPCFEFIDNWVTSGTFNDPANEFFIQRNNAISLKSASFWEKGITLRQAEPDNQQTPVLVPCFLLDSLQQILLAGKSVNLIQGLGKMAESSVSDAAGSSLYQNFLNSLLSAVYEKSACTTEGSPGDKVVEDENLGDKDIVSEGRIALANKADILAVTKEIGDPMLRESLLSSAVVAPSTRTNERECTDQFEHLHSGLERCLVPVEVLFKKSLTPLLQTKYTQACGALISLLKSDYNLMDHLNAMKNFFLLEAGDTMHHFYLDIFKKIRRRHPWQDISYLNSLLQEALYPRFPHYIDRLAVSLDLAPNVSGFKSSSVQTLQSITLNYKVPWPVSLVIDENCLKKYNQVFLFLLTVKRAKWSLDELRFTDLSGETHIQTESSDNEDEDGDQPDMATTTTNKPVNQELIHKMYLLRFRLLHFVNSLHNYIMTRILHTTGLEFQEAISKAVDLNAVIAVHRAHVDKVFDRCLLSQKIGFVKEAITKVLNLALLFQAKWDASVEEFNEEAFNKIDTEFSKCNHFVITFLDNIVKRGAFPHLEALAFSLSSLPSNTRVTQGISMRCLKDARLLRQSCIPDRLQWLTATAN